MALPTFSLLSLSKPSSPLLSLGRRAFFFPSALGANGEIHQESHKESSRGGVLQLQNPILTSEVGSFRDNPVKLPPEEVVEKESMSSSDSGLVSLPKSRVQILEPKFRMTFAELIDESGVAPVSVYGDMEVLVTGIQNDSRKVIPGNVFVCCAGYKTDGHCYVAEAIERGAVAVVASRELGINETLACKALLVMEDTNSVLPVLAATFYGHPSKSLLVTGITGTNGKTTTAHLIRAVSEALGKKTGMLGSVGYYVHGNYQLEAPNTTPNAVMVQELMAEMARNRTEAVVMEVSSVGLSVGRCDEIDFDIAVFMNLTRDHLDFHGTEEEYRSSKAKMFARMVDPRFHRKIVNIDDPNASFFIAQGNPDVPVVTFAMENKDADVYPMKITLSLFKTRVVINTPKGMLEISSSLVGRYNIYNILAAVAVGIAMDAPSGNIVRGIEAMDGVPGRFELINEGQNFALVVDYAHSPDSFSRLLDAARELGARRIITVFGCAGETDKGKRPILTKLASEKSDVIILTSGNPKSENQFNIFDDMLAGIGLTLQDYLQYDENFLYPVLPNGCRLFLHDIRRVAIRAAVAMGKEGDMIFVLGRGHESYQIEGVKKRYIDDREECREALQHVDELHRAKLDKRIPMVVNRDLPVSSGEVESWRTLAGRVNACST
ncbi:UDP-N-acetylmuramoyl-L-alanyl-D-glutamate--2,6-diaminopimelate ligase MurE homolog, chloroplastic-like [Phoenix dactylifera]|uniref:UDP-N-acetylmuramoyl-L-alanyl-D-glutamate--2, 6-diaminopimelate ligase MurE homolog, chloroplastic-like n=1 Tax=Phoenix dactylifera TaxID=42345 RepID=A0A8B7BFN3_PHODC|nr:UDP-N-acetylmuramoyl-L-alanyl-D-glutamate--2,6-diaminopimelate ligase MurE homolog, chloroplastic-like [Phoenix dactylifera]